MIFDTIYYEKELVNHPRLKELFQRYPKQNKIACERYQEIFNRKAQNFRLQKQNPALIIAEKKQGLVLETPESYGIGGSRNFYFSHMLNCLYDCRYCFLQGMYRSANFVLFINYEDFMSEMKQITTSDPSQPSYFFSGYDCDSLALDHISDFINAFYPFFTKTPQAILELRTKSTRIQPLLQFAPIPNCIVAFTLSPEEIIRAYEHRTPRLKQRLAAIKKLQKQGWLIGLRFDPLIFCTNFKTVYANFFAMVFESIDLKLLHSITLGTFRLPKTLYANIFKLYPDEKLFCQNLSNRNTMISYKQEIEDELKAFCQEQILQYCPDPSLYPCEVNS